MRNNWSALLANVTRISDIFSAPSSSAATTNGLGPPNSTINLAFLVLAFWFSTSWNYFPTLTSSKSRGDAYGVSNPLHVAWFFLSGCFFTGETLPPPFASLFDAKAKAQLLCYTADDVSFSVGSTYIAPSKFMLERFLYSVAAVGSVCESHRPFVRHRPVPKKRI